MRIALREISFKNKVFDDLNYISKPRYNQNTGLIKPDTFELNSPKKNLKIDKKYIVGAVAIGAGVAAAIIFRKNISNFIKSLRNTIPKEPVEIKQSETTEKMINNAKDFLIKDVEKTGEATVNGICFYGPDSMGKEQTINEFLDTLANAGYKIEKTPRAKEASIPEIGSSIRKYMEEAEKRFKTTNQRTVIVVRDLDKISQDRRTTNSKSKEVVGALIGMQDCRKKGYAWISEAVDVTNVDPAIVRMGRMEHKIPVMPLPQDSKSVWNEYIALIKRFREGTKKEALLKEAQEIMERKGI